ncbi:Uncharacterised protein [Aeromonas encheleia]|nr:Uncharacterised protein [Aeromonas encheleia]
MLNAIIVKGEYLAREAPACLSRHPEAITC